MFELGPTPILSITLEATLPYDRHCTHCTHTFFELNLTLPSPNPTLGRRVPVF